MKNILAPDGPIANAFNRILDLLIINALWLLCSLPVITLGASTSAMYYVTLKLARKEEGSVSKMFFRSFRDNLKQGIILTCVFAAVGILLYIDYRLAMATTGAAGFVSVGLLLLAALFYGITILYAFPLQASFANTVFGTLKRALLIGLLHPFSSIVMLVIQCIPLIVVYYFPKYFFMFLPVWLLIATAALAYLFSLWLIKVLEQYSPQEEEEQ